MNDPAPPAPDSGDPFPERRGVSPATLLLGATAAALAGSWLWSRGREEPVERRTRDRLAPPSATAGPPSARDIHVS